jgi:hypothetical protein
MAGKGWQMTFYRTVLTHCLTVSFILYFKMPGNWCGHFVSLGCDLQNQVKSVKTFAFNYFSQDL